MEIRKRVLGYSLSLLSFSFCSTQLLAEDLISEYVADICPTTTVGLCTPSVIELIETEVITESSTDSTGITEIETTTVTTTTTTTTNEDSGDILDSDNGFVSSSKSGEMNVDWGGQGPASMPTGSTCGDLGTDKCAEITGSGSSTSTMGVAGMGTTFIQTVDVQNLNMADRGGRVNYTIKVHKQDDADSIYMHITGRDGTTSAFAGTDLLSAAGVATGYAEYTGGFDFGGNLTSVIIEIGGRDINLAIGPVFDDVTVNVLWNVVNTIITQHITTIETFIATGGYDEEVIDIAEDIFNNNDFDIDPNGNVDVQPNFDDDMSGSDSYESVELELEMPTMDVNMDIDMNMDLDINMDMDFDVDVTMDTNIEMDIEIEMDLPDVDLPPPADLDTPTTENTEVADNSMADSDLPENTNVSEGEAPDNAPEMEQPQDKPEDVVSESSVDEEPKEEVAPDPETKEPEPEPQKEESETEEEPETEVAAKEEPKEEKQKAAKKEEDKKEEPKQTKAQQKQDQKQKAGSKIVKNMGDKGRYDSTNQLKTLLVMQVLGNSKTFFDDQKFIQDTPGFFSDLIVPDTQISDNNFASFIMFGGSNVKMDALVDSQYNN